MACTFCTLPRRSIYEPRIRNVRTCLAVCLSLCQSRVTFSLFSFVLFLSSIVQQRLKRQFIIIWHAQTSTSFRNTPFPCLLPPSSHASPYLPLLLPFTLPCDLAISIRLHQFTSISGVVSISYLTSLLPARIPILIYSPSIKYFSPPPPAPRPFFLPSSPTRIDPATSGRGRAPGRNIPTVSLAITNDRLLFR